MNNDLELIEELYDLMKIAVAVTKRGEIEEDYTKTISLDIGDGILFYDPYYNKLSYEYNNNPFIDEEDIDEEKIPYLIEEIKKRLEEVENKIKEIKDPIVKSAFNKPLECFEKEDK